MHLRSTLIAALLIGIFAFATVAVLQGQANDLPEYFEPIGVALVTAAFLMVRWMLRTWIENRRR